MEPEGRFAHPSSGSVNFVWRLRGLNPALGHQCYGSNLQIYGGGWVRIPLPDNSVVGICRVRRADDRSSQIAVARPPKAAIQS